jgi:hypothetical protein
VPGTREREKNAVAMPKGYERAPAGANEAQHNSTGGMKRTVPTIRQRDPSPIGFYRHGPDDTKK